MKPADVHIWEKYVRANPGKFLSCDYDVPVGQTPDWLDDNEDAKSAKQGILYRKKIDVVAFAEDHVCIIEVKPFAGSSALGQIMGYEILYRDEFPDVGRVVPMVVTNQCQNGYREIFARKGIVCIEAGVCERCAHYPAI